MKYSKRELKTFNIFALLLFALGGFFLMFGGIELAFQPTTSYTVVREYRKAASVVQPSEEPVVSSSEEPATLALEASVEELPRTQRKEAIQETVVAEGPNFKAISNVLLGVVFLALSFGLNFMLLRVMRRARPRSGVSGK